MNTNLKKKKIMHERGGMRVQKKKGKTPQQKQLLRKGAILYSSRTTFKWLYTKNQKHRQRKKKN